MAAGEALELALGLLRAPARRELLAARPLPGGITGLLAVAAGSRDALREAADRTGAGTDELQEAARFFVQQVLLIDGADAYRTLGAARDASHAQLNEHHRLLQRWLHPDRDTEDAWDSVFSARVNAAWSRLRTPRVREAYDAELATFGVEPTRGETAGAHATRDPGISEDGYVVPDPGETIYRNPNPPGAPPGIRRVALIHGDAALATGRGRAADTLGHRRPRRSMAVTSGATIVVAAAIGLVWFAFQHASPPRAAPVHLAQQPATPQVPVADLAAALTSDPAPPPEATLTVDPVTPVVGHVGPTYGERPGTPNVVPTIAPEAPLADHAIAPEAPIAGHAIAPTPTVGRGYAPDAPRTPDPALRTPDPEAVGRVGPTYRERPGTPNVVPAIAPEAPTAAHPAPTHDPFALFEEAERTVAQLADWLVSSDSHSPPIWNDIHIEAAAAASRASLHARIDGWPPGRVLFESPHWQLGDDRAAFDGGYRIGSRRALEHGQFQIELVRREQRWLVTAVNMEPAP